MKREASKRNTNAATPGVTGGKGWAICTTQFGGTSDTSILVNLSQVLYIRTLVETSGGCQIIACYPRTDSGTSGRVEQTLGRFANLAGAQVALQRLYASATT